ncbi:hypothetical protein SDJN02_15039 [Cucurbita argyrosperma subsp. argyrosperma]|nr:hypothetical protein SDJN02_15039 [Cucurbita argyrosperma subsp. argyrosperma]
MPSSEVQAGAKELKTSTSMSHILSVASSDMRKRRPRKFRLSTRGVESVDLQELKGKWTPSSRLGSNCNGNPCNLKSKTGADMTEC